MVKLLVTVERMKQPRFGSESLDSWSFDCRQIAYLIAPRFPSSSVNWGEKSLSLVSPEASLGSDGRKRVWKWQIPK